MILRAAIIDGVSLHDAGAAETLRQQQFSTNCRRALEAE
jgi:hypothetical protein